MYGLRVSEQWNLRSKIVSEFRKTKRVLGRMGDIKKGRGLGKKRFWKEGI